MPGLNQTGPIGQGSMTGRRMGKCTNFATGKKVENTENKPKNNNNETDERGFGTGFGRSFGGGHGFCGGRGMGRRNRNRGFN